jgi:hypothetical protein
VTGFFTAAAPERRIGPGRSLTCRESEAAQIIQFGAGGSTARRECGLDVGALVGFGAEQF